MMVSFKLTSENLALTEEEKQMLTEAKKLPVVYDEDSPALTEKMKSKFIAARKAKPRSVS